MGVKGLENYLHQRQNQKVCRKVNIKEICEEYRRKNGRTPVIVMDGLSCLRPLYGELDWVCGGQFKAFYYRIQRFLNGVKNLGCDLVVYFEGPHDNPNLDSWKEKRLSRAEQIRKVLSWHPIVGGSGIICLPNGLENVFLFALSEYDNCKVFNATSSTDYEVAKYAFDNKCFAILAQDTDYVIFRAAEYYLSMKFLDIDLMTTTCYDGNILAEDLDLDSRLLPLFATLLGNDIVDIKSLMNFHKKCYGGGSNHSRVEGVAKFINKNIRFGIDSKQVSLLVFGSENMHKKIQDSISFYDLEREICAKSSGSNKTQNDHWKRILEEVDWKISHDYCSTPLYDIMVLHKYFSSNVLEDYKSTTTPRVGDILKGLRRCMYGILLHENRQNVAELVMAGEHSLIDYKEVQPKYLQQDKHPGLLALWNKEMAHDPEAIQEMRWNILGDIFQKSPKSIRDLPPSLLIPALTVRYLLNECYHLINDNLNAIIASYVCFKHYNVDKLSNISSQITDSRQVWLYTALSRTHSMVFYILYFIGEPIPRKDALCHNYTDGKLFHMKYQQSQSASNGARQLCENNQETLNEFNKFKSFVTWDRRPRHTNFAHNKAPANNFDLLKNYF